MKLNLDKAKEILELLQEDTITPKQVRELIAHLVELSKEKKEELFSEFQTLLDTVSQETYQKIRETISILNETANSNQSELIRLTDKQQKAHDKQISELKEIVTDLKSIKYKDGVDGIDGIDGKDADEEKIVEDVLARIPEHKEYELTGENVVDSINALDTNPENQIDAKHIKNLPEIKGGKFIYGNSSGIKELVAGTNVTIDNTNLGYPVINSTSGLSEEFETVSKNLKSYPYDITYTVGGDIDFITYDLGGGMSIIKTFNYTSGDITSIVLSDDTPAGISLTKTLSYSGGNVDNVVYS